MPRKKIIKEPLEKVKNEQVVLEIIEDSSDEEALPPPPPDTAIRVSKGNEVISQMNVEDIKEELTPKLGDTPSKPEKKKRTMTDEHKAKMKAGRERKKAERALQAGKKILPASVELKAEATPPPAPVVNTDDPPIWFQKYLASQKKPEHEIVKETEAPAPAPAPAKKSRGRPKGKKDTKPRNKKNVVVPEPVAPSKPSIRFI